MDEKAFAYWERGDFVLNEALREEVGKSWGQIVSDELVYVLQPLKRDFEVRRRISGFNWVSKYDCGEVYIDVKFAFLGERNTYFNAMIRIASPNSGNCGRDRDLECDVTDRDDPMLVDVAKSIQLPEGMILERRPSFIWLKRLDNGERWLGNINDFFLVTFVGDGRTLGINGESSLPSRFIGSEQRKLPSQMVKPRPESISELPDKHTYRVGGDFLFDIDAIPRLFNVVLSVDEVGIFPKFGDFPLEFIEALIPPTKFHLRIGKPDPHRLHDTALISGEGEQSNV